MKATFFLVLIGFLFHINSQGTESPPSISTLNSTSSLSIKNESTPRGNPNDNSFSSAKKLLMKKVYFDQDKTFYCDAKFTNDSKIINSGEYLKGNTKNPRSKKLEWEHIVPAEAMGRHLVEWSQGHKACINKKKRPYKGRRCAGKVSSEFRRMESDLYNLVPAIGEVNQRRAHWTFTDQTPTRSPSSPPPCDMHFFKDQVRPPEKRWGDIARIYLYMDWAYPTQRILSEKQRQLYVAWDKIDPPDAWECLRTQRIENIQGNPNPFSGCKTTGLNKNTKISNGPIQ